MRRSVKCTISERTEKDAWLTRCLSAVAELLVVPVLYNIHTSLFIKNTDRTKKKKKTVTIILAQEKHQKATYLAKLLFRYVCIIFALHCVKAIVLL